MKPNYNRTRIILVLFVSSFVVVCIVLGILSITKYNMRNKVTITIPSSCVQNTACTFSLPITKQMPNPIYIYYYYNSWFTSYFVYLKSSLMSDLTNDQIFGESRTNCYPIQTYNEFVTNLTTLKLPNTPTTISTGNSAHPNNQVYPCGLKAALYSNLDVMSLTDPTGNAVVISDENLYYSGYKKYLVNRSDSWTDITNGRFMSWIIPSVPAFGTRFLWGKIDSTLAIGTYTVTMTLYLKSSEIDYTPSIELLSEVDVLANLRLGIILIATGLISIILLIFIFILKYKLERY